MQGIAEAIKYLYQQFILRDVVAYVTPGTILTVCALKVYLGSMDAAFTFIKAIPAVAYIPIYGFLFIIGLGIQNLGEVLKVLPEHNRLADAKNNLSRDEVRFAKLQEFHRATFHATESGKPNDFADALERTRERIEVKKYASGNIAAAIVLSAILIGIARVPLAGRWAIVGIAAIVVACLVRAHHRQMKNVTTWEDDAINAAEKP